MIEGWNGDDYLIPNPTSTVFGRFRRVGGNKLSIFNTGISTVKNSDEYMASIKSINPLFFP
jgi:hypothetical protein